MAIRAELTNWIHRELLISIAACDYSGAPLLARCLAVEITADGTQARIYLNGNSAQPLFAQLKREQWLAVVMEQPRTHRSLQIKGKVDAISPMSDADIAYCQQYQQSFTEGVIAFGFTDAFSAVFIPPPDESASIIQINIEQVYEQSPGTQAGQLLETTT